MSSRLANSRTKFLSKIRAIYLSALGLLAILLVVQHFSLTKYHKLQSTDGHVINLSGRQRMLCQRVAKELLLIASQNQNEVTPNLAIRKSLYNDLVTLQTVQRGLRLGDAHLRLPTEILSQDLIKEFNQLEVAFQYIFKATMPIALYPGKKIPHAMLQNALTTVLANEDIYLQLADKITDGFEAESTSKLDYANQLEAITFFLILVVLILEGVFVFYPMERNIAKYMQLEAFARQQLGKSNADLIDKHNDLQTIHEEMQANEEELRQTLEYTIDLKEQIEAREAMLEQAQKLANLGTCIVDGKSGNIKITEQVAIIFGIPFQTILPRDSLMARLHPEDQEEVQIKYQQALKRKEKLYINFRIVTSHNDIVYVRAVASPTFNLNGGLSEILIIIQDVSKEHLIMKEINAARREAEAASTAKGQFLSVMSHEIRTPLNAVIGFSQLLLLEDPKPDQIENLDTLNNSANHLLHLINDILDYSKIEEGKLEFEHLSFNLQDLLRNLIGMFKLKALEKNISLTLKNLPTINSMLIGDTVRLNQILTNLVGNSLKFTHKGGVTIGYQITNETDTKLSLQFSITDTGIGIPKDKIDNIFESFTQASSTTTREFGGTGLGLAISKRLVDLQGGSIWLDSTEGKGTTFFFSLTFGKADLLTQVSTQLAEATTILNIPTNKLLGVKVLLVEDNHVNILVASKFLKRWGIDMMVAHNGQEALNQLQKADFDLILMDLQMPIMDGYEATKAIRQLRGAKARIPIVALTASTSFDVRQDVLSYGMDDYLTKPFNANDLLDIITRYTVG